MKNTVKYILQKVLGFKTYLYVFAQFKIKTLAKDKKEGHFFQFMDLLEEGAGDILDIGANIGIMTHHLSTRFSKTTIHSFEPMPDNLAVLRKVVQKGKLSNVIIHPIAVGEKPGTVKMILPENGKTKEQGLAHIKHDSITEWNDGIEYEVELKTIDDVLVSTPVQGIKMDVENFEYFALKGAQQLLSAQKPIIYTELWDNENRTNCFNLLEKLGYSTYVVVDKQLVNYKKSEHTNQNFIFIAK